MGKIFDSIIGNQDEISLYLKKRNFYESTMEPRFMNDFDYNKLNLGVPCLRRDIELKENTVRIFVNGFDVYCEVQSPWRSCVFSCRYNPADDIMELELLLDEVMSDVLFAVGLDRL